MNLEQALEFCRGDECVEVTPAAVRIRKVVLSAGERARTRARAKTARRTVRGSRQAIGSFGETRSVETGLRDAHSVFRYLFRAIGTSPRWRELQ